MTTVNVIRAWKDERYRAELSDEQRAQFPHNPAGLVELSDEDLGVLSGARPVETQTTWHALSSGCCPFFTHTTCIGFTVCGAICNTAWCTASC